MRNSIKMLLIYLSLLGLGLNYSIPICSAGPGPVIMEFVAEPVSVLAGESSLLTWSTRKADTCELNPGNISVPCNGSRTVRPTATTAYYLTAGNSKSSTGATVTIIVTSVNHPPSAENDSAATDEDMSVTVNLLANDTDADGDLLTIESIDQSTNGTVNENGNGVITYTPAENFNGSDSFSYTVNDANGGTDTGGVSITVNPVNDPPTAHSQSLHTVEDTQLPITLTASDVENDPLTYTVSSGPVYGSLSGTAPALIYQPGPVYQSSDSFTFKVSDGHDDSSTAIVSIAISKVNYPPVANDDSVVTDEDAAVMFNVLENDTDADNNELIIESVSQPPNGTIVYNNYGIMTYTPDSNFNTSAAAESFEYIIIDGNGGSSAATVSITVNPVNDPPEAFNTSASTGINTPVEIMLEASDMDDDPLNYIIVDSRAGLSGTISGDDGDNRITYTPAPDFSGYDTVTFKVYDGTAESNTATVTITVGINEPPAAEPQIITVWEDTAVSIILTGSDPNNDPLTYNVLSDPVNGQLTGTPPDLNYIPSPDYHGSDTFGFVVSDGQLTSNLAVVTITVSPVNDPPAARNDLAATADASPITTGNVLANDTDIEGDILTIVSFTQPEHGSVVDNGDNTFTYTPEYLYSGLDSFNYTVTDGNGATGTAQVLVTVHNPPPTVSISSSPGRIVTGETSLLTWNSSYATMVSIDNGIGEVDSSGSLEVSPQEYTTYSINVSGFGGSASDSTNVEVWSGKGQPSPIVSISAAPEVVLLNKPATLTWSSSKAVSLNIDNGIGSVGPEGSREVFPDTDTTYTITATDRKGNKAVDSVTVKVTPLDIEVYSPVDGEAVSRPDVLVRGIFFDISGNETGVKVNGRCALSDDSEFAAGHVRLVEGDNTVIVTATNCVGAGLASDTLPVVVLDTCQAPSEVDFDW
ncbi:MAG: tandem-95 repeat protein, partial [Deltaproteobacteria bacterium]|nr:tandem-95 repeat protein [Deltaproteobacteria bacterium]